MSKIQNVKTHITKYKAVYITGGVCLVVGAVVGLKCSGPSFIENNIKPKNQNIAAVIWKPKQTLEVHIEALGDPGNIIQDTTTGAIYASQNQAAKALGVNRARISEQLAGKIPDVNGHSFDFLGKAHVSEVAA